MLFNTAQYGIFFVIVFAVHWVIPRSWRHPFLLLASYYFYASAIPQYLLLILGLTVFNYGMGLWIGHLQGRARLRALWLAIVGDLGSLAYFKYTGLIVASVQPLLKHLPLLGPLFHDPLIVHILLPLGISFFAFEFIHHVVEVYRGQGAIKNPLRLALFAAFFPTQIAGPIKRFPDFMKQLAHPRKLSEINIDGSIGLILRGLLKKILIADTLAPVVAQTFGSVNTLGPAAAWFAIFAFALQIYCDFSGYTDIGTGCAQLLGYSVPVNFRSPYQSKNPSEFWHRWHVSLSSWLQDYLYIPLGGSRVPKPRIYLNLMITMALGGLWHGAQWHFLVWGIYQGALLCAHRYWKGTVGKTAPYQRVMSVPAFAVLGRFFTLIWVCIGWVFFRADTLGAAFQMLGDTVAFARPVFAELTISPISTPALALCSAAMVVVSGWIWAVNRDRALAFWQAHGWRLNHMGLRRAYIFALRPAAFTFAVLLLTIWPPHALQQFIYFRF